MNRNFIKTVIAVVLGICLVTMIMTAVGFISEAALADDLLQLNGDPDIVPMIKWTALSLALLLIPAVVCYVFTCFTGHPAMNIFAAAVSFVITLASIVIFIVARNLGIEETSANDYATVSAYFPELLQYMVSSLLVGVFYVLRSVYAFKERRNKPAQATMEATEHEEA